LKRNFEAKEKKVVLRANIEEQISILQT